MSVPLPFLPTILAIFGRVPSSDFIVVLLLLLLLAIILTAGGFIWLASVHARDHKNSRPRHHRLLPTEDFDDASLSYTALINMPHHWIAVQGVSAEAVVNALKLKNLNECTWTDGLVDAGQNRIFISPRIGHWTLIMGDGLPDPATDVDTCFHFLHHLSIHLGHVQFFSANRALGFHAWAKFYQGNAVRAYAWAGQTVWNQGPMSAAEIKLGATCHQYFEDEHLPWQEQQEISAHNIELIPALAARWSIDPAAIDARKISPYPGLSGELQ
jgi:hypothetical protein